MKNWRTTALGILSIAACVISVASTLLSGGHVDFNAAIGCVATALTGLGLIHAADAKNV
jgi:hypothetical protein